MTEVDAAAEALVAARRRLTAANQRAAQAVAERALAASGRVTVAARVHAEVGRALTARDRAMDDHRAAVERLRASLGKPAVSEVGEEPIVEEETGRASDGHKQERVCAECDSAYQTSKYSKHSKSGLCKPCRSRAAQLSADA
jgi:hypothetical protein